MNWNCLICGDDYNNEPTKSNSFMTVTIEGDVKFICPSHADKLREFIQTLKEKCAA